MIYLYAAWYIFTEINYIGYQVEIKEEVHC